MNVNPSRVAYLGPNGTFAHIVAKQRFDGNANYYPQNTIADVFRFVESESDSCGIVPIENSSGGNIYGTIDELVDKNFKLKISDQIDLNVKLSLMGKVDEVLKAKTLYSHFAALNHCGEWVAEKFPHLETIAVSSTAEAARRASESNDAVALASSKSAELYSLNILAVPKQTKNVTQFIALSKTDADPICKNDTQKKVSIVVGLPSTAGSLCDFLLPFKSCGVNLSRILSRPSKGTPNEYIFLFDLDGALDDEPVKNAIEQCKLHSNSIKIIGNYSKFGTFES